MKYAKSWCCCADFLLKCYVWTARRVIRTQCAPLSLSLSLSSVNTPNSRKVVVEKKSRPISLLSQLGPRDHTQACQLAGTVLLSTHFLRDPDSEVCKLTNTTRAPYRNRPEARGDRVHHPQKLGDAIAVDHKVLNEENKSRLQHRCAVVVQDLYSYGIQRYPTKNKNCAGDDEMFAKVRAARSKTEQVSFKTTYVGITTTQPTPIRNQWNGRKRISEGQRRYLCTSGTAWRGKAMKCFCYFCETHKTTWHTRKSPYERRFGTPLNGPVIPLEAEICF